MSEKQEARLRRWGRRIAWCLAGLIGLWLVAWLAIPPILKSQAEKLAQQQLGRKLTLGAVDFRPWTLELTIHDLAVASADGSREQLHIKRIYIDAELQSVLRLAPVVDAVEVDEPVVELRRFAEGRYDVDDLIARLSQPSTQPAGEPAKFALYNLRLRSGRVRFTDDPVGRTHELSGLDLSLPFVSNLESKRQITVAPHLAFSLNGSRFDTSAQGTPFAQTRQGQATLKVADFDLKPYLGYLPQSLPVRPAAGVLRTELNVAFEQDQANRLRLDGFLEAAGVELVDARSQELAAWGGLRVELADVRPLERVVKLAAVSLEGPRVHVRRDAAGQVNWAQLSAPAGEQPVVAVAPAPSAAPTASAASAPAASASSATAAPGAAAAWQFELPALTVRDLAVSWQDASVRPASGVTLTRAQIDVKDVIWPMERPAVVTGSGMLGRASLSFTAEATDRQASATVQIGRLPLSLAGPYLAATLEPTLSGEVQAQVSTQWRKAVDGAGADQIVVQVPKASFHDIDLAKGSQKLASVKLLEVSATALDLARRTVGVGRIHVAQPRLGAGRDAQGRWMFESWLKPAQGPAAAQPATAGGSGASPAAAWQVRLDDIDLDGGAFEWRDLVPAKPMEASLRDVRLQVKSFVLGGNQPMATQFAAHLAAGQSEAGRIDWRGTVALDPVRAKGELHLEQLPLHAFEPYFGDLLNVEVLRADAGLKGQVDLALLPAGMRLALRVDGAVEDLRVNSLSPAEELLNWKALNLRGVEVDLSPDAAARVRVGETVLTDFFARIIVSPQGRFNLQDLVRGASGTATVVATATVTTAGPPAPAADISFGPMSLVNGKVFFSDRFIKPNYSANLSELTGKLGAFRSAAADGQVQMADVELRGRAEGTASLEILGKLNPLAKPLALDIKGKVRELELPPLSPYSVKYAGYGIERGKLSVDVSYLVQPNGQLTASNNVVLNQLEFGDKVEGGGSLPVKLAVALLKDRNGVIDINLPVSGSLNDPQFSVGPIIFKLIFNLIAKAITAPFSLLASALGGGGDEMNLIGFPAGRVALDDDARKRLDTVAKAVGDRPGLKVTAVGTAGLEQERDGFKREQLVERVRAEKRRTLARAGQTATAVVSLDPAEYPALLKEVYRRSDMPKPRNAIGMLRDLPVPEMEALLLADIKVSDDAMRQLAVQRSVVVKDYLAGKGLAVERLFLGAPKVVPPEAKWTPRVELSVEAR